MFINIYFLLFQENGFPALLTSDDQLFMFEAAGVLIVHGESPMERKTAMMTSLLQPLMDAFNVLLNKLSLERDEEKQNAIGDCLSHAVGFARYLCYSIIRRTFVLARHFISALRHLRISHTTRKRPRNTSQHPVALPVLHNKTPK